MYELKIVTPTRQLLKGDAIDEVFVPAHQGELNILPGHAPLVTTLQPGVLKYKLQGRSELQRVAISWGYCEVHPNGVTILAETAETPQDIDRQRAESTLKAAEERLLGDLSVEEFDKYQRKVRRANARMETLEH